MSAERLQKVLASAGIASRRDSEALIAAGRVTVNGRVVQEPGLRVDLEHDTVLLDGAPVRQPTRRTYLMLHKPVGFVSTVDDPHHRPTVVELVDVPTRVFPVGRLDVDSEGLILLTDDGELTHHLTHPKFEVEKEYRVLLDRALDAEALRAWRSGLLLNGELTAPARVVLVETTDVGVWYTVVLREGRKRQIRETARTLGYEVRRLIRVREGNLLLGDLPLRAYRPLTDEEVADLRSHIPAPSPQEMPVVAAPPPTREERGEPRREERSYEPRREERGGPPRERSYEPRREERGGPPRERSYEPRREERGGPPRERSYEPRREERGGPPRERSYEPRREERGGPPRERSYEPRREERGGPPRERSYEPRREERGGPPRERSYEPRREERGGPPRERGYEPRREERGGPPRERGYEPRREERGGPPQERGYEPRREERGGPPRERGYEPRREERGGPPRERGYEPRREDRGGPPQERGYEPRREERTLPPRSVQPGAPVEQRPSTPPPDERRSEGRPRGSFRTRPGGRPNFPMPSKGRTKDREES